MNKFSKRSLDKLGYCHMDIQKIMKEAITESPYDFGITHGYRTPEEQNELYKKGRENNDDIVTYMDGYIKKSKHNYNPSLACDIAIFINGQLTWEIEYYIKVAYHIMTISDKMFYDGEIKHRLNWGGDWKRLKDYPHFQI